MVRKTLAPREEWEEKRQITRENSILVAITGMEDHPLEHEEAPKAWEIFPKTKFPIRKEILWNQNLSTEAISRVCPSRPAEVHPNTRPCEGP